MSTPCRLLKVSSCLSYLSRFQNATRTTNYLTVALKMGKNSAITNVCMRDNTTSKAKINVFFTPQFPLGAAPFEKLPKRLF